MSEKYVPKVGDEVEAVVRGEVAYVSKHGCDVLVGTADEDDAVAVVPIASYGSLRKVSPPLPTAPGSVIRAHLITEQNPRNTFVRTRSGMWRSGATGSRFDAFALVGIEVIFDAGEEK